jgi:hypothetical protein
MEIVSNFEWTWVNWTRNIFPNISRLSFKVLEIKPGQTWCLKWWRDYWWNDGTKSAWQWWVDMRVSAIGSRNWQGTCMGIITCMWSARMTRWLGGAITWSGGYGIRTCHGHGVAYRTPITFLMASWSISVNDIAHTLRTWCKVVGASKRSHNRVESCTQDMYRHQPVVMINDVLAASGLFLQRFLGMM